MPSTPSRSPRVLPAIPSRLPYEDLELRKPWGVRLAGGRRPARARRRPRLVRRTAVGGLRYTAWNAALNRRMLPNPAENATADIGIDVSSISRLARWTRRVVATAIGEAPAWRANSRRR